jgi:hypothetical protein
MHMTSRPAGALLAAFLLLTFFPRGASGQDLRGWGIKGGVAGAYQTFSYVSGRTVPAIPRTVAWGLAGSIFAEFLNGGLVNFVLEAGYVQKGRKVTSEEIARSSSEAYLSPGPEGTSLKLGYATVAVSFKVRMSARGSTPFVCVGPRFDFLVSHSSGADPVFDHFKKSDIGVNLGIGMEFAARRHPALSLEARWSPGFSRVFSNDILGIKNDAMELLLAIWF